jgi:hypothetical protein
MRSLAVGVCIGVILGDLVGLRVEAVYGAAVLLCAVGAYGVVARVRAMPVLLCLLGCSAGLGATVHALATFTRGVDQISSCERVSCAYTGVIAEPVDTRADEDVYRVSLQSINGGAVLVQTVKDNLEMEITLIKQLTSLFLVHGTERLQKWF